MTDCVLRAPVQFRQRRLKVAIGPSRHAALPVADSRFRSKADIDGFDARRGSRDKSWMRCGNVTFVLAIAC